MQLFWLENVRDRRVQRWAPFFLLAIVSGCQCSEDAESPEGAPYTLSILEVTSCPAPPEIDVARVRLVGVKVRLVGHHARGVPANYFYASVLTTDGDRYLADAVGCSPRLSGAPLAPGQAAEGFLNFPLPNGKIPDKVVYSPAVEGQRDSGSAVEVPLDPLGPSLPGSK